MAIVPAKLPTIPTTRGSEVGLDKRKGIFKFLVGTKRALVFLCVFRHFISSVFAVSFKRDEILHSIGGYLE